MIELGRINTLKVLRESGAGFHLGDEDNNEVLLPLSFVKTRPAPGEKIKVFIYRNSDDKLTASPRLPVAHLNHFACLRVTDVTGDGAYLDWGLEKDLFVPYNEQRHKMEVEKFYVIYIYVDEVSDRIVGSSRIDRFISNEHLTIENGQEVEVLLFEETPLGWNCIINEAHKGLIYHNDIYKDVFVGDEFIAYVKNIREDNLVDISFQKGGFQNVLSSTEIVLERLANNNGFLALHDKSSPDEIATDLNMSKATYKKAIGVLYRHRKILIKPDGIYLVAGNEKKKEED